MQIKPFRALRPAQGKEKLVAAVPYDVVNSDEARRLAEGNPESFLHVTRPEIDLPPGTDLHSDAVYVRGADALRELQERGALMREKQDCIYLYRQIMAEHSQTGVVLCCHIDDYASNRIRKHEKTRQDKEDDRTRHVLTMNANSGPVFLTCRDDQTMNELISDAAHTMPPLYDFTAQDGVRHTVWRINSELEKWIDVFEQVPLTYVADGHHRAAAAWRAGEQRKAENPRHDGSEEYNWFLAVVFPASQLNIMAYNRCVVDLNGLSADEFLKKTESLFQVEPTDNPLPDQALQLCIYLCGNWYKLRWEPFEADPVKMLDVSVLQDRLLAPLLGIDDPRTDTRIDFIGGIRGTDELVKRVDSGRDAVAFSMCPVSIEQMMDIADANQIMPPKSTWFEPKLRSGLFIHTLD
jgi:uncharacterized protein (DUF1015 family)